MQWRLGHKSLSRDASHMSHPLRTNRAKGLEGFGDEGSSPCRLLLLPELPCQGASRHLKRPAPWRRPRSTSVTRGANLHILFLPCVRSGSWLRPLSFILS